MAVLPVTMRLRCRAHRSNALRFCRSYSARLYTPATPLLWPEMWFSNASTTWGSTPISCIRVAVVLRRSCNVQGVSVAVSSWRFSSISTALSRFRFAREKPEKAERPVPVIRKPSPAMRGSLAMISSAWDSPTLPGRVDFLFPDASDFGAPLARQQQQQLHQRTVGVAVRVRRSPCGAHLRVG